MVWPPNPSLRCTARTGALRQIHSAAFNPLTGRAGGRAVRGCWSHQKSRALSVTAAALHLISTADS